MCFFLQRASLPTCYPSDSCTLPDTDAPCMSPTSTNQPPTRYSCLFQGLFHKEEPFLFFASSAMHFCITIANLNPFLNGQRPTHIGLYAVSHI